MLPLADSNEQCGDQTERKPVKTEVRYSWYYYDRDEQLDGLIDVLTIKGQREKRLGENLRKVRDRLKLKKIKKSQSVKLDETKEKRTEGAQSEKLDETKTEGEGNATENINQTPKQEGAEKTEDARATEFTTEGQ